jgi:hypothetical protein
VICRADDPRRELEEKIDELVREYYENQGPEIPEQIDNKDLSETALVRPGGANRRAGSFALIV